VIELEDLYQKYFQSVYRYLLSITKDQNLAEDLTADTFMKAIKSIDSFKGQCDLRVWLCQIGKNSYYSHLRKQGRIDLVEEIPVENSTSKEESLDVHLMNQETSLRVHKVLHHLKEPYKEVFTLRVFGELSFKSIGEIFQRSENWACVTFHRSRKKILEELEEIP
jgi:RNA polymerase sigma factor (sigma-70 family)